MADSIEFKSPDPAHALPRQGQVSPREVRQGRSDGASARGYATGAQDGRGRIVASNPDEMRDEIQHTRARMSDTLDALEARLGREKAELNRRKDDLVAKATLRDFRHTISQEPWRSLVIAFVAGYVVAALRD